METLQFKSREKTVCNRVVHTVEPIFNVKHARTYLVCWNCHEGAWLTRW